MSYVLTDKPYIVTMGHAPIPQFVLKPSDIGPMSSEKKLVQYIATHKLGVSREVACLDEEDAIRVCNAFSIPSNSLYYKKVIKKMPEGVPDRKVHWKARCRA